MNVQAPDYDGFKDEYLGEYSFQLTHERRHALIGIDGKDRTLFERDVQILGAYNEIARGILPGGIEEEPVEVVDGRQALLVRDGELVRGGPLQIDLPCCDAAPAAELDEDIHDQTDAVLLGAGQ